MYKGTGKVSKWIHEKGFGFIEPVEDHFHGVSIFAHLSALHMDRSIASSSEESFGLTDFEETSVAFDAVPSYIDKQLKWKAIKVTALDGRYLNADESTKIKNKINANLYCKESKTLSIQTIEAFLQQNFGQLKLYNPEINKLRFYCQEIEQDGKTVVKTRGADAVKLLNPNLDQFVGLDLNNLPIEINTQINKNNCNNDRDAEDEKVCKIQKL